MNLGQISTLNDAPSSPPQLASAKIHNLNNPESLVDIEESLGVKLKQTATDVEVASLNNDPVFNDAFIQTSTLLNSKSTSTPTEDATSIATKPITAEGTDMNAIQRRPTIKMVDKPKLALGYELLDDDFTEMSAANTVFQTSTVEETLMN